jgi:hypothetical protein
MPIGAFINRDFSRSVAPCFYGFLATFRTVHFRPLFSRMVFSSGARLMPGLPVPVSWRGVSYPIRVLSGMSAFFYAWVSGCALQHGSSLAGAFLLQGVEQLCHVPEGGLEPPKPKHGLYRTNPLPLGSFRRTPGRTRTCDNRSVVCHDIRFTTGAGFSV